MNHLTEIINANKDKEVVLFNSPLYRDSFDDGEDSLPPLGLGYILTYLDRENIPTGLVDAVYDRLGVEAIACIINSGTFHTVGFNVFSVNLKLVKEILFHLERNVHIMIGGKIVGAVWKEIAAWDVKQELSLIIGEGELITPDIVRHLCAEVLYEKDKCKVYQIIPGSRYFPADLDRVCLDRSVFQDRAVVNHYGRLEQCLIASRGCIYRCAFCGGSRYVDQSPVRFRSNGSLREEIGRILELMPQVRSIRVLDDLFLRDAGSIENAIALFNDFTGLHWRAMAHIQSFLNAERLVRKLKACGCDELFVGIESGSPRIRKMIHKEGTVDKVKYVVKMLLTAGIDVKGYFICGFPDETDKDLKQTLCLAEELKQYALYTQGKFRASAFRFRPYHGTELYDRLRRERCVIEEYATREQKGTKTQYNFSAGNFSCVSNASLDDYLERITNDRYHIKLPEM